MCPFGYFGYLYIPIGIYFYSHPNTTFWLYPSPIYLNYWFRFLVGIYSPFGIYCPYGCIYTFLLVFISYSHPNTTFWLYPSPIYLNYWFRFLIGIYSPFGIQSELLQQQQHYLEQIRQPCTYHFILWLTTRSAPSAATSLTTTATTLPRTTMTTMYTPPLLWLTTRSAPSLATLLTEAKNYSKTILTTTFNNNQNHPFYCLATWNIGHCLSKKAWKCAICKPYLNEGRSNPRSR